MALWTQREEFPGELEEPERDLSPPRPRRDSFIAADLTVEGRIEGAGNVRIAGRFRGDVHVEGELTVEPGAHITGDMRAETIRVGGEVHGNLHAASRVELLESGMLIGDLMAGSLTAAAGSRMRGKVEFGWAERDTDGGTPTEERESSL